MSIQSWSPSIACVGALAIFAGTVVPYLTAPRGSVVGYLPLSVGAVITLSFVGSLTFACSVGVERRIWKAIGTSVAAGAGFVLCFLFLVLNTSGT